MKVNCNSRPVRRNGEGALAVLREFLAGQGLRLTEQRVAVHEGMLACRGHFSAEGLHDGLRQSGHQVSQATVYRTLSHLKECGLVREVSRQEGRALYESVHGQAHHDHMVCVACGRVIEFCDERIEELQRLICRRHRFEPLEHRMIIRGRCEACSGRSDQQGA